MNFLRNTINFLHVFLFFSFFAGSICVSAMPSKADETGIPFIQTYTFPDFCLSSGKFSVYEDSSGIFLIGAKDKLIIFYGNEFKSIKIPGRINLSTNQKALFYSGLNSFGLVKLFKNSQPQILPLLNQDQGKTFNLGQVQNAFFNGIYIVLNNTKKAFLLDSRIISGSEFNSNGIKCIDSSANIQLFRIGDDIYLQKKESGLHQLVNGQIISLPGGDKLTNEDIETILSFNGDILIKTKRNPHFLKLSGSHIEPVKFGFENFLQNAGFSDAISLGKDILAIGTKSAGVIIFNSATNSFRNIGVNEGLLDNTVTNLHKDKAGNLWVLHDIGISRIELNIPVTTFGIYAGINSGINDIKKYKNTLYLATANGLLKSTQISVEGAGKFNKIFFQKVDGIINECIKIIEVEDYLYIVTPTGIYDLHNNQPLLSLDINSITKSKNDNNLLFIGNEQGFSVVNAYNKKFITTFENDLNGLAVAEIAQDTNGNLWLKTSCNKIIYIDKVINEGRFNYNTYLTGKNGLPNDNPNFHLLETPYGVRFCFPDTIYSFNYKTNNFQKTEITDLKSLKELPWLVEAFSDVRGNKWYHVSGSLENIRGVLMYSKTAESHFKPVFFNTGMLFSPIYIDSGTVWIGGNKTLLKFSTNKPFNLPRNFSAIIKRVIVNNDSILNIGLEDPEIDFKFNNIRFEIASTCFEGEPYIRYQYMLEGYSQNWTNWTMQSYAQFKKLMPGKYIFKVRVLNVDGIVSDNTELAFYILPPFYLTLPAYLIYFLVLAFLIFVIIRWRMWIFVRNKEKLERILHERTEGILREKEKSEILLANILPKGTADELKTTGKASSQKFNMATVLFSDIQGFTKIAEQMNPEMLIDQLDAFFFHFDSVIEKYDIEKIKTIGDAYMCAGGIPKKNITNPVEVVLAALEMQEYMRELKSKNTDIWDLRIGIHTGSVIAGVVGQKKFSYDIWGDTVNTASRMESSGEAGKINISGHTYELVKDFFISEYRGKMPVKYKGDIDMYFVKGIRPELAVDMRFKPNRKFYLMLQLLRLQDVEEEIMSKLEKELPDDLYFHSPAYLRDIYNMVYLFGRAEELTDEENLILRTAALFQDTGYTSDYDNHEDMSIKFAQDTLKKYQYSDEQIQKIIELIEVTKRQRKPQNKMEEIMLDADMNYLGRADFITLSENLYKELHEKGKVSTLEEWNNMQIVLLSNHKFYSNIANILRDVSPEQQIENIIQSQQKT